MASPDMKSQSKYPAQFSIEFFPPKNEKGEERLRKVRDKLAKLDPLYVSVTFGAGGSTQEGTYETVKEMLAAGLDAAPHLSCIGTTRQKLREILQRYQDIGVKRIVALRGDMPSGMRGPGEFNHANQLVEFIREETGDHFHLEVAAYPEFHPQAKNAQEDLRNFKRKVEAGADAAITQYFFNADAYYYFVDSCEEMGVDLPIVPGIMPITNYSQLARFSDMCGAEIPRWIRKRLEAFGDDTDSIKAFGVDFTIDLCDRLLSSGAPGLHFYSMNQSGPTTRIWEALDIASYPKVGKSDKAEEAAG